MKEENVQMQIINAEYIGDVMFLEKVFLLEKQLDILEITKVEGWNRLHRALFMINKITPTSVVQFYIDNNVEINAQDCYGMTPLHYAMRSKNAEAAKILLEAGADPNIPDCDYLRPLSMIGSIPDRLDILELMLKKGGNVDNLMEDGTGRTILESWLPYQGVAGNPEIYDAMKKYSQKN